MANLNGHEAGNGGHSQGEPARHRAGPRPDWWARRQAGRRRGHDLQLAHPLHRREPSLNCRTGARLSKSSIRCLQRGSLDNPGQNELEADTGIGQRLADFGEDVDQDIERAKYHGDAQHRWQIGAGKSLNSIEPKPRPREDPLDDKQTGVLVRLGVTPRNGKNRTLRASTRGVPNPLL